MIVKLVLGIDPGLTGGIVGLDKTGAIQFSAVMPARDGQLLVQDLLRLICTAGDHWSDDKACTCACAYVERAQPFPKIKSGVIGQFKLGRSLGILEGLLCALHYRYELVTPRVWQRQMHAGVESDNPKTRSAIAAGRLFSLEPLIQPRCKKPHQGLIDALLIAEYGRRQLWGRG